jgi:hypothetical protein
MRLRGSARISSEITFYWCEDDHESTEGCELIGIGGCEFKINPEAKTRHRFRAH